MQCNTTAKASSGSGGLVRFSGETAARTRTQQPISVRQEEKADTEHQPKENRFVGNTKVGDLSENSLAGQQKATDGKRNALIP